MNLAAFAVIVARERETGLGDGISSLYGIGANRPLLAWPMTIAMLSLAGFPATAGFFGKITLIGAAVDNGYAWLGVVIVLGSAISLAYYLRVVAAVWMRAPDEAEATGAVALGGAPRPAIAGGSAEADADPAAVAASARLGGSTRRLIQPEVIGLGVVCAAATIFFGIYPGPLLDVAQDAAAAFNEPVLGTRGDGLPGGRAFAARAYERV